jgi:hypothetical protein
MRFRGALWGACCNVQFSIAVFAVGAEVLADGDSLLDEHVQVFGNLGRETCSQISWIPI